MITKIEIAKFKRWDNKTITLHPNGVTIVAGPNNIGKSTLLQALAVWNFCRVVVEHEKGYEYLCGKKGKGIGVALDDFYPMNIPNFQYLWTNLTQKQLYSLKIACEWNIDPEGGEHRRLKFGLGLVQDRLFIKVEESNVQNINEIPNIAILTPFAGIDVKEEEHSPAVRARLIGKGLSGAVLRNEIKELFEQNVKLRKEKKQPGKKDLSKAALREIRETDPFEILQSNLIRLFGLRLNVEPYHPTFHSYLKITYKRGEIVNSRFKPFKDFEARDIMSQGSGFLQWLSVFTYALSPNIKVLLLDEPDSHLHCTMQVELLDVLQEIAEKLGKQILVATHSTEIIRTRDIQDILQVSKDRVKYLTEEKQRVGMMANLGSTYSPRLDKLKNTKSLFLVENQSDADTLRVWAKALDIRWPEKIVVWPRANHHKERKHLHDYLVEELHGVGGGKLKTLSLSDRDTRELNSVSQDLKERDYIDEITVSAHFAPRCWRRHEIESYMLHPSTIARMVAKKRHVDTPEGLAEIEDEVRNYLINEFSLCFDAGFTSSAYDVKFDSNYNVPGHETLQKIGKHFHTNIKDIPKEMQTTEIFEDVKKMLQEVNTFF